MNHKKPSAWLLVCVVVVTIAAAAVVVFVAGRSLLAAERMAVEQFNIQQLILARSAARGVEAYYQGIVEALESLAEVPSVEEQRPECLQCMQQVYWGFPERTSIRLLDKKGILRFIYPFDGWRGELIGRDYSKESYFQEAKEKAPATISYLINEQGDKRIRIAVPVYSAHENETVRVGDSSGIIIAPIDPDRKEANGFQGVLIGSFDEYMIAADFIPPIISGKTGYAWMLSEEGIFLAHYEKSFTGRNAFNVRREKNPDISYEAIEQIQRRMMAGEEGTGRYISGWYRGKREKIEKLVAYTPVHINNHIWSVAVCAPVSEVEQIVSITRRSHIFALVIILVILVTGGLFSFLIIYRWFHFLENMVEKKTRELRVTGDYLNKLIKYANAPIIVWNPEKRVTIFNKAFEKLTGLSEAEMAGRPLDVLFPEKSRADSLEKIERTLKGEFWDNIEIPVLNKNGETRIGLWNSANIYDEEGKTLVATVVQGQDITERKRGEERLCQMHKMEAVGTLAGGIAHDFNNILTAIIGYTQLALAEVSEDTELHSDLKEVLRAGNRAKDLVRQILTFSRRHAEERVAVSVSPLVEEALKLLRSTLPSTIVIEQKIEQETGNILADPTQVHQIVMNLCTNAAHAMEEKGGVLEVCLCREKLDLNFTAMHPDLVPGDYIILKVKDTGIGIELGVMERIFEPYFTTKEKDKGTGLGLAVVHGIVKSYRGAVTVSSEPGKGSVLTVYLPVIERMAVTEAAKVESLPHGSECILFVDDEQSLAELGKKMLESLGYRVFSLTDSSEALKLFRKEPDRFDLVITDITMPRMTGDELAKEILSIRPDIPVIICTGYSERMTEAKAKTMGIRAFIMKPVNKTDIAETVRRALER
jgi:PAS domain S-box-containing protein